MGNEIEGSFDAIVVGSGPGGATTARELTRRRKKVLILEWGPDTELKGTLGQYIKHQAVPFKSLLLTEQMLGMVRGVITGGSSVFYYGTCFKVPIEMFESHGVDISQEVEEAKNELPVAPLKDEMMTPMAERIMQSARELGYEWRKLDKFMYQDKWRPDMKFGYYGDPNGVKWSARMYLEEARQEGATLIADAKVKKVLVENGKATGVEFKQKGELHRVMAPLVVVSAGGIGSPVILRNSGIREAGFDFFFDPLITVCGTVKDLKAGNEIPMSAGIHMEEEGYMMTDMALPPALDAFFSLSVLRIHKTFSQPNTLRIMVKAKDALGGKVTDGEQVRKRLIQEDREKLTKGSRRAREILKKAGAKSIFRTGYLASHPGGTVKIGEILDPNLKTKQFDNLYVCDCSVIPEAWGLPPTLTLISLGKRLAKHLTAETSGTN
ncbi:MAG: GMC family oxidoreductase [Proteobacteria bacterium]|nr:GMC family oxidoreductase [Pseudomonadota bacterium]